MGASTRSHGSSRNRRRSPKSCARRATPARPRKPKRATWPIAVTEFAALIDLARKEHVALTIVGPEIPLVAGIVDQLRSGGPQVLRAARSRRAARGLERLHEGVSDAPRDPDGGLPHLHGIRSGARLRSHAHAADRHQGRRPRSRQRRDHRRRRWPRLKLRSIACCAQRQFGAAGTKVVIEDFLRRRGSELHRDRRRHARRAARELARPQDARRRRPRPEHRRHGRLLAGARRHRVRARARHARNHAADRARPRRRRHLLPRLSVRRSHDRRRRPTARHRVQLPAWATPRRSRSCSACAPTWSTCA